jgi:hypothetical protein
MSDEEQQEEGKRFRSLGQDGMDAHSSGEEGGEEEESTYAGRMHALRNKCGWTQEEWIQCGGSAGGWRETEADSERRRVATQERRW